MPFVDLVVKNNVTKTYELVPDLMASFYVQHGMQSCTSKYTHVYSLAFNIETLRNTPMQYTAIVHGCKNDNFQLNVLIIFIFLPKTYIVYTC